MNEFSSALYHPEIHYLEPTPTAKGKCFPTHHLQVVEHALGQQAKALPPLLTSLPFDPPVRIRLGLSAFHIALQVYVLKTGSYFFF